MRTCRPEYLVQVGGIVFPQLQVRSHHKYDKEAPDKRGCIETFPRDNLLFQWRCFFVNSGHNKFDRNFVFKNRI